MIITSSKYYLDITIYLDGGAGYCTDGKTDLSCLIFASTIYAECESACTFHDGCVAFDINVNGNCNLRFGSKNAMLASPNLSQYGKWGAGCGNNCNINYAGRGGNKGRCWVKKNGK